MKNTLLIIMTSLICLTTGCQDQYEKSLHKVAKDWCLTIRASQVIPIYPLSQDVQVGDVFLVSQTVDDQHKQYSEDGFLPLPQHIGRIDGGDFTEFYKFSFADEADKPLVLPKDWFMTDDPLDFKQAPAVSFPEYSFSITNSAGANFAIPVQGVPIGLSLLNANSAKGSVVIKNARTYGANLFPLYDEAVNWAEENHSYLVNYAATLEEGQMKYNYIRVISRVYLAGEITVSLDASKAGSAGLSAGAPKPVELLTLAPADKDKEKETMTNYADSITQLNKMIAGSLADKAKDAAGDVLPGGTVKVVAASAHSISMKETFDKPIPVGYLAFDMYLDEYGFLGPPIPTKAVLKDRQKPQSPVTTSLIDLKRSADDIRDSAAAGDQTARKLRKATKKVIKKFLPLQYPVPIYDSELNIFVERDTPIDQEERPIANFAIYVSRLYSSKEALENIVPLTPEQKKWLDATNTELGKAERFISQNRVLLNRFQRYAYNVNGF